MKKYILLLIGLLMITSNAWAVSAYDNEGNLVYPEFLTVKEAYILSNQKNTTSNHFVFIGYERGILQGVLQQSHIDKVNIDDARKILTCIYRPLIVYDNFIFSGYEAGKISGDNNFGTFLYTTAVAQCCKE